MDVCQIAPEDYLKVGESEPQIGAAIFRSPEAMLELRWDHRLIFGRSVPLFFPFLTLKTISVLTATAHQSYLGTPLPYLQAGPQVCGF